MIRFLINPLRRCSLIKVALVVIIFIQLVILRYFHYLDLNSSSSFHFADIDHVDVYTIYENYMTKNLGSSFTQRRQSQELILPFIHYPHGKVFDKICHSREKRMLLFYLSPCRHFNRRKDLRASHGKDKRVSLFFLLNSCPSVNEFITEEANSFQDIIQLNRQLLRNDHTPNVMSALNVTMNDGCRDPIDPKWILVVKDDYKLNMEKILKKLSLIHRDQYEIYSASYVEYGLSEVNLDRLYFPPYPSEFLILSLPLAQKVFIGLLYSTRYRQHVWLNMGSVIYRLNLYVQHWPEVYPRNGYWFDLFLRDEAFYSNVFATNSALFMKLHGRKITVE